MREPQLPRSPDPAGSDDAMLRSLGYEPELKRRMSAFSNFAISLSIICILAGGITSFHVGLGSVGGAALGIGWPLGCLFALAVAMTMAQVASAFPTAGGLYHWGSILGGRFCGWTTAWFNLAGLVTVLATVNSGTYDFALAALELHPAEGSAATLKLAVVVLMTLSQGLLNHFGIRWTTRLTDLSGWLILVLSAVLAVGLLAWAPKLEWARLWTFTNFSGAAVGGAGFPRTESLSWLFLLGLMLPAYTITGFDASAHTAEETVGASVNVPRGIVRSVWISGLMGWVLVMAITLALPSVQDGVERGAEVVPWVLRTVLPGWIAKALLVGIVGVQYLCGLAALTSASRMVFAFARDGGLPGSGWLKRVSAETGSPAVAVWMAALTAAAFTILVPYTTIAVVCTTFLYLSYVIPVAAGFLAWGRSWTKPGPWQLGKAFRPLAAISVAGCIGLLVIGVQPPNELALRILAGAVGVLLVVWFGWERRRFRGPPQV
jgi:amino acid transporter